MAGQHFKCPFCGHDTYSTHYVSSAKGKSFSHHSCDYCSINFGDVKKFSLSKDVKLANSEPAKSSEE